MDNKDLAELEQYRPQLPHLLDVFAYAREIEPSKRLEWAKYERRNIYRDGWFINTPVGLRGDAETVEAHVQHLKGLIQTYFPKDTREQADLYAENHDDHEILAHAIINGVKRDLNPRFNQAAYNITLEDKEHIERIARRLLFEDDAELLDALDAYPQSPEQAAILFREFDKICVMWRCADFVDSGDYSPRDFNAYWEYWTPKNVRKKCSDFTADIYEQDLWPRVLNFIE